MHVLFLIGEINLEVGSFWIATFDSRLIFALNWDSVVNVGGPPVRSAQHPIPGLLAEEVSEYDSPDLRHLAEGAGEDLETGDDVGNHGESIWIYEHLWTSMNIYEHLGKSGENRWDNLAGNSADLPRFLYNCHWSGLAGRFQIGCLRVISVCAWGFLAMGDPQNYGVQYQNGLIWSNFEWFGGTPSLRNLSIQYILYMSMFFCTCKCCSTRNTWRLVEMNLLHERGRWV